MPMKTKISAEIVAHSINKQGDELISLLVTFPRMILAEVNTHRMLSKNTSSSRAIPFAKMVESVKNDPFIPIAWQKEHKGMQGTQYWEDPMVIASCKSSWLFGRDRAVVSAETLNQLSVTKQLANRLLEPFMWTTMLITGPKSGWDNFFRLRCPEYRDKSIKGGGSLYIHRSKKEFLKYDYGQHAKDFTDLDWLKINEGQAEIHIMDLAEKIYDACNESTPVQLKAGQWHIPFWDKINLNFGDYFKITGKGTTNFQHIEELKVKVSVAMAARTSYTVVGEEKGIDIEAMIGLHDRLLTQDPPHSSPLEHCARCMYDYEYIDYIRGFWENGTPSPNGILGWCNNFKGFIPYRYMVDNGQQI